MYFITCNKSSRASCMIKRSRFDGNGIELIVNVKFLAGNIRIGMSKILNNLYPFIFTEKDNHLNVLMCNNFLVLSD